MRQLTLLTLLLLSFNLTAEGYREVQISAYGGDLSELFQMLADGKIKPQIWKILPLTEAAQAHRYIEAGEVRGKIVLRIAEQKSTLPLATEPY
ncbi:MAG: NADPH:quinone reductase-like Zn-dependent oxidoreductase [Halieaceae bacterium]|jgi:NADPH:quinone reductase-like Zn-dependent oxidoreductase